MAKRRTLKCPKCKRKFSMAAHLARHLNAIHGTKRRKKIAKKKRKGRAKRRAKVRRVAKGKRRAKKKGRLGRPTRAGKKKAVRRKRRGAAVRRAKRQGSATLLGSMRAYRSGLRKKRTRIEAEISSVTKAIKMMSG